MKKLPFPLKLFEMIASVPKAVSITSVAVFGILGGAHLAYASFVYFQYGVLKNLPYFLSSSLGCFALMAIYYFVYQMSKLNQELVTRGIFLESYFEENMDSEMDDELLKKLDDLAINQSAVIDIKTISKELRTF